MSEIAPGVYFYEGAQEDMSAENLGAIANIGFIVGEDSIAVIDSGGSARQGEKLLAAIRAVSDLPIRYVINSHMHPDHVFGNHAFLGEAPQIVGHAKLPRALTARGEFYLQRLEETLGEVAADTQVVPPNVIVEGTLEIDLGSRPLVITAYTVAHTDNDLTVLDVTSGTLWLGDLLFVERTPVIDGSLNGWLAVMDQLAAVEASQVVPGHGPLQSDWPGALTPQRVYLEALRDQVRRIIAEGGTMAQALEEVDGGESGPWLLFEDNHLRNVTAAFKELEWE
ncbi:MAG: quinoprotein relay system zinc metallohydrolase 2 [Pseudomonadota bacterium]